MCTVLLSPGDNPIAVNKYIILQTAQKYPSETLLVLYQTTRCHESDHNLNPHHHENLETRTELSLFKPSFELCFVAVDKITLLTVHVCSKKRQH